MPKPKNTLTPCPLLIVLALLLTACFARAAPPDILLANIYYDGIDPTQYLVSEKYDGVRAVWDGRQLRFRSGQTINAPDWFVDALPKTPLDGELWLGRGRFERLSGIVRRETPVDEEWRQVRYMLFELPGGEGDFRQRANALQRIVEQADLPWLQAGRKKPPATAPRCRPSSRRCCGRVARG